MTKSQSKTIEAIQISKSIHKKIGIVVPTYNAKVALKDTIPLIRASYPNAIIFAIDDLSKDGTPDLVRSFPNTVIPYIEKKRGYGKSLIQGLTMAYYEYGCDYVIEMDADHPTEPIYSLIEGLDTGNYDIIIGVESGKRITRGIAIWLVKRFYGLSKFRHPTCGYVAFTNEALKDLFEPNRNPSIKANNDFVHIEILFKAVKKKLRCGELEFSGKEHKKHRMSIKRIVSWTWSFTALLFKRTVLFFPFRLLNEIRGE